MSSENECLLGDVAELVRGVAYKPDSLLQSGQEFAVPLLRATNIGTNTLELKEVLHVPSHLVKQAQYLRKYDVVIAMSSGSRSAVGRLAQLRCDWFGTFGAFCGAIRPIAEKVDAEFLGYLLYTPEFRARIETYAAGTAIMNLSRENLLGFPIRLPTCKQQRAIAQILGAIDDRITLLRETNATLEAIAQALFKSWFVDFDPVRAKMEGRSPEGMDDATAALFPDALEETELGPVPRGWKTGTLGDVAQTARRQLQVSDLNADLNYVGLEHVPRKSLSLTEWGNAEGLESAKAAFAEGDILFGRLRPYFHKVVVAPFSGVCSTDILVCQPIRPEYSGVVTMHLFSEALIQYADRLSNGAKMPRVSWKDLAVYPISVPPPQVAEAYNKSLQSLMDRMKANIHQAQTLATLRDTLLPRLISGQLRVPEAIEATLA